MLAWPQDPLPAQPQSPFRCLLLIAHWGSHKASQGFLSATRQALYVCKKQTKFPWVYTSNTAWRLLQSLWHKPRVKPEESVSEDASLSKEERTTVFRDWEAGCMCNACTLNVCSLLSKGQYSPVKQPGQVWHSQLRICLNVSDEESLGSAHMGSVPAAGNYSRCNHVSPKLDIPKPLEHKLSILFKTRGSIHAIILLANGQNIPREREIRCSVVS